MLVVQLPDGEERRRRLRAARRRGLAYVAAGLVIMADLIMAPGYWWFLAAFAVETWWFWAVSTDPGIRR